MPRPTPPREYPVAIGQISDFASFSEVNHFVLTAVRGDSLRVVFRLCEAVETDPEFCGARGISPQTLEGYVARCMIRPSVGTNNTTSLTCEVDEDAGSGRITVTAPPTTTRLFQDHGGVFDLEISDGTEDFFKTVVSGPVKVVRDITV